MILLYPTASCLIVHDLDWDKQSRRKNHKSSNKDKLQANFKRPLCAFEVRVLSVVSTEHHSDIALYLVRIQQKHLSSS